VETGRVSAEGSDLLGVYPLWRSTQPVLASLPWALRLGHRHKTRIVHRRIRISRRRPPTPNPKDPPSPVQLRTTVWIGDDRDTRPVVDFT